MDGPASPAHAARGSRAGDGLGAKPLTLLLESRRSSSQEEEKEEFEPRVLSALLQSAQTAATALVVPLPAHCLLAYALDLVFCAESSSSASSTHCDRVLCLRQHLQQVVVGCCVFELRSFRSCRALER